MGDYLIFYYYPSFSLLFTIKWLGISSDWYFGNQSIHQIPATSIRHTKYLCLTGAYQIRSSSHKCVSRLAVPGCNRPHLLFRAHCPVSRSACSFAIARSAEILLYQPLGDLLSVPRVAASFLVQNCEQTTLIAHWSVLDCIVSMRPLIISEEVGNRRYYHYDVSGNSVRLLRNCHRAFRRSRVGEWSSGLLRQSIAVLRNHLAAGWKDWIGTTPPDLSTSLVVQNGRNQPRANAERRMRDFNHPHWGSR